MLCTGATIGRLVDIVHYKGDTDDEFLAGRVVIPFLCGIGRAAEDGKLWVGEGDDCPLEVLADGGVLLVEGVRWRV